MKRLVFLLAGLLFASTMMVSCLKDDDKESKMKQTYEIDVSTPVFANIADTTYTNWVYEGLSELQLSGSKSIFETRDTSYINSLSLMMANCNTKAREVFKKRVQALTMQQLKEQIYASRSAEMSLLGITNPIDIPFDSVSMTFYLISSSYFNAIDTLATTLVNPKN